MGSKACTERTIFRATEHKKRFRCILYGLAAFFRERCTRRMGRGASRRAAFVGSPAANQVLCVGHEEQLYSTSGREWPSPVEYILDAIVFTSGRLNVDPSPSVAVRGHFCHSPSLLLRTSHSTLSSYAVPDSRFGLRHGTHSGGRGGCLHHVVVATLPPAPTTLAALDSTHLAAVAARRDVCRPAFSARRRGGGGGRRRGGGRGGGGGAKVAAVDCLTGRRTATDIGWCGQRGHEDWSTGAGSRVSQRQTVGGGPRGMGDTGGQQPRRIAGCERPVLCRRR